MKNYGVETEMIEFKKSTSELKEGCVSIAAMLNKHGVGTLYFGVKNNGDAVGQDVSEETLRDVSSGIARYVAPQIYPIIRTEKADGNDIIVVEFNGEEKPYSADGRYYIRISDEDRKITSQSQLRKMFMENGQKNKWEKLNSPITDKDIDRTTLQRFYENATKAERLPKGLKVDGSLLQSLGLMYGKSFNQAGAALFAKKAGVVLKMAVFATNEKLTFLDMVTEEDNILNLIETAEKYIFRNIRWKADIVSTKREEIPEIPSAVIREVIANSFAHAIYNSNTQHEICIHPGFVSVYNPGSYASEHSPKEYVRKNIPSAIRNELIAKALYLNKSIDQFGSGFKRIDSLCKDAGLSYFYEDDANGFKFIIRRNSDTIVTQNVTVNGTLNLTEQVVYAVIKQNPEATRAEIADKVSKSVRTVQRAIDKLRDEGYIEREGSDRAGFWIAKK